MLDEIMLTQDSVTAIVGAGGKTSLMLYLARMVPRTCLITTTTKVGSDQILEADARFCYSEFLMRNTPVYPKRMIWVSPELSTSNTKISGFELDQFSEFAAVAKKRMLPVIVEADGAHMRHIKAPAQHEPVIPKETNFLLHVTGMDVLGKPADDQTVHRLPFFLDVTELREGDILNEESIIRLLLPPEGGFKNSPSVCKKIAVLNQVDTSDLMDAAYRISKVLLENGIDDVWISRLFPGKDALIKSLKSK
jgi:probable selenium-dependent hydroxylase accessory protein YqeC